jgi:hypothetical protein
MKNKTWFLLLLFVISCDFNRNKIVQLDKYNSLYLINVDTIKKVTN